MPGFNYRMTELQGAIGKVQLSKLNFMVRKIKKDIKFWNPKSLKNLELRMN